VSALKEVCGSDVEAFNQDLLNTLMRTAWLPKGLLDPERQQALTAMILALKAFKPADEIEGMLAAQAIAQHNASMECARRAMLPDQSPEAAQGLRKGAANSSRAFVELLARISHTDE
jgi:Xaa-Pro aminopeptidase